MKVKDLKKALENVDGNLDVIVINSGSASEYQTHKFETTDPLFLEENPDDIEEFIISI